MKQRLAIFAAAGALVAFALPGLVAAADAQVVAGRVIGAHGTLLVATSNQMTVYTFDKDVAGSGASNCTGGCLTTWPALTVAAGDIPTGGAGVTGTLGTITRADNGALQVTYNGLPLYFFSHDAAPGDTNGIYPNWRAVVLAAAAPSATATPTEAPAPSEAPQTATPPPTSTAPAGTGSGTGGDAGLALLVAGVAGLGGLVAIRRRAAVRS
jgi:predicted lipoprotein with Yx(FWY)xxD motif